MISALKLLILLIAVFSAASPFSVKPRANMQADNYIEVQCRGMHHASSFHSRTPLTITQARVNTSALTPQINNDTLSGSSDATPMLLNGKNVREIPFSDPGRCTDTIVARAWNGNICPHTYNTNAPDKSPAVDEMLNLMPECHIRQRGKTWLTFPMMEGGNPWRNRTRAGPDRVIVVADGTGLAPYRNFIFCGSIFHPLNPEDKDEVRREDDDTGYFEPCSET